MPNTTIEPKRADEAIRAGLAAADRRRRSREASRRIWRAAPILAAAGLVTAAISRWSGWPLAFARERPALAPMLVLAVGAVALAIYAVWSRRHHQITDSSASAIDAVAGLGGELRSASWFAARENRDEWAEFHLERAAERLKSLNWSLLYPAIRAPRARLATGLMLVGALLLTMTMPERVGSPPTAAAATSPTERASDVLPGNALLLSPELQRQLEALLAAADMGNQQAAEAAANNSELREMLSKLTALNDRELLEALARALAANPDAQKVSATQEMKELADRARHASEMSGMSPEMREALEKLADELEQVEPNPGAKDDGGDAASAKGPQLADAGQSDAGSGQQELSIQFAKEADPGGAAGVMMLTPDADQGNGPPGAGVGGAGSQDTPDSTMANINAALRQELVEASQDNPGTNVETEIRRKTEHGNATVAFTGGASGKFDRTRAAAPPRVPETRRTGVQTYFGRKPQ